MLRHLLIECLGYGKENGYKTDFGIPQLYGQNKDTAAKVALEMGLAVLYIAYSQDKNGNYKSQVYKYYTQVDGEIHTIGRNVPLLTEQQFAKLVEIMSKTEYGMQETLMKIAENDEIAKEFGFEDKDDAENFQALFGIIPDLSNPGKFKPNSEFELWWKNFKNSHLNTYLNKMLQEFKRMRMK